MSWIDAYFSTTSPVNSQHAAFAAADLAELTYGKHTTARIFLAIVSGHEDRELRRHTRVTVEDLRRLNNDVAGLVEVITFCNGL